MNKKSSLILTVAVAVALVGGIFIGQANVSQAPMVPVNSSVSNNASIMLDYGDGNVGAYEITPAPNENLFQAMQKITKDNNIPFVYKEYSGLGAMISKIGNKESGSSHYWQYWVNNKYSSVGASSYIIKQGDIIEWKYSGYNGQ